MGNKHGKAARSKEDKAQAAKNRTDAVGKTKAKVQHVQDYLVHQSNPMGGDVVVRDENVGKAICLTETAKHQLDREGNALTKADLMAIVVALTNNKQLDALEKNTVKDLNTMIRTIVYDPSRYISLEENGMRIENGPTTSLKMITI